MNERENKSSEEIKLLFDISASLDKVYEAIVSKQGISSWWCNEVSVGQSVGEDIEIKFGGLTVVLEISELVEKSYVRWDVKKTGGEWDNTSISFKLKEEDGGTELTFSHSGWTGKTPHFSSCVFQWAEYLIGLKNYCEVGKGFPFQMHEKCRLGTVQASV